MDYFDILFQPKDFSSRLWAQYEPALRHRTRWCPYCHTGRRWRRPLTPSTQPPMHRRRCKGREVDTRAPNRTRVGYRIHRSPWRWCSFRSRWCESSSSTGVHHCTTPSTAPPTCLGRCGTSRRTLTPTRQTRRPRSCWAWGWPWWRRSPWGSICRERIFVRVCSSWTIGPCCSLRGLWPSSCIWKACRCCRWS